MRRDLTHDSNNFLLVRRLTLISVNTLRSSLNFDIVLDIRCSVKHPFSSVVITCPRYVNFLTFSITCSPMLNSVDFSARSSSLLNTCMKEIKNRATEVKFVNQILVSLVLLKFDCIVHFTILCMELSNCLGKFCICVCKCRT